MSRRRHSQARPTQYTSLADARRSKDHLKAHCQLKADRDCERRLVALRAGLEAAEGVNRLANRMVAWRRRLKDQPF